MTLRLTMAPLGRGKMSWAWCVGLCACALTSGLFATDAVLFDFTRPAPLEGIRWYPQDDPVMGGKSWSHLRAGEGELVFEGVVSLDNYGGFAASFVEVSGLADHGGLRLRLRGTGKRLSVWLPMRHDSTLYYRTASFEVQGELTVDLPWSAFRPTRPGSWRGGWGAPPLDPAEVVAIGLCIADKQAGRFAFGLRQVEALPVASRTAARP